MLNVLAIKYSKYDEFANDAKTAFNEKLMETSNICHFKLILLS